MKKDPKDYPYAEIPPRGGCYRMGKVLVKGAIVVGAAALFLNYTAPGCVERKANESKHKFMENYQKTLPPDRRPKPNSSNKSF